MPNIIGRRYLWFLVSALVIIPGIIAMIFATIDSCNKQEQGLLTYCGPLRLSIDFTGGTLWELTKFEREVLPGEVRAVFEQQGITNITVQTSDLNGEKGVLIRTLPLTGDQGKAEKAALEAAMHDAFGSFEELRYESVGPVIGQEITQRSQIAVLLAAIGILLYITYAFRSIPNSFRYGVCAISAVIHDVLVVVGSFAILGLLFDIEIDALFLTALLTVIGFSVHDTIVVFDRIRENRRKYAAETYENVVNFSIFQTLDRSINTTLTVLFTLGALFLFGGATIHNFIGCLLIGLTSSTYSTICNAIPLLVVWENKDIPKFFARLRGKAAAA